MGKKGEIRVKVKLENNGDLFLREVGKLGKQKIRAEEVDAMVDTGAVMMLLSQDLVKRIGLGKLGKAIVTLANEQKVELDRAGTILVTVAGRKMPTDCLVGPPGCEPLIGQLVMESLDLTPRPESPYLPSLKLK